MLPHPPMVTSTIGKCASVLGVRMQVRVLCGQREWFGSLPDRGASWTPKRAKARHSTNMKEGGNMENMGALEIVLMFSIVFLIGGLCIYAVKKAGRKK